jgi:hypothetical protein
LQPDLDARVRLRELTAVQSGGAGGRTYIQGKPIAEGLVVRSMFSNLAEPVRAQEPGLRNDNLRQNARAEDKENVYFQLLN